MIEVYQPYINAGVLALVGLFVLAGLTAGWRLYKPARDWLRAGTSDTQRQVLHRVAMEAVALLEATLGSKQGQAKLLKAKAYVNRALGRIGSSLTAEDIEAAIEKAVADYKTKQKGLDVNEHHQA